MHAIPIDGDKVQALLDEIGRFEPSVRAVIYPACQMTLPAWANVSDQMAASHQPTTRDK